MALGERIKQVDERIAARFRRHRSAAVITSLPGIGTLLGAEFLVATGGDMAAFAGPATWPADAGLAPDPVTRGGAPATCTGPDATTACSTGSSTHPPWSASRTAMHPGPSTTASAPKARNTPRPCWPWPAAASTSCGPCSATTSPTSHDPPPARQPARQPDHRITAHSHLTNSLRVLLGRAGARRGPGWPGPPRRVSRR